MSEYVMRIHEPCQVHHTACLSDGVVVWPYTTILAGVTIGQDCVIGTCCLIGQRCILGPGCRLQSGAYVSDGSVIGARVAIGPHVVLADVPRPCLHDRSQEVRLPVMIEDDVVLGANSTILPGVTVGRGALVGAGAVVTRDVLPGATMVGNPARPVRQSAWVRQQAESLYALQQSGG